MKIYSVADIHGSQYRLNLVLKNIQRYSPDLVVVCGDITQFGPGDVAKNFLDQIPVETIAVTGNIDSPDVERGIDESKATRIELKKLVKKGITFVGTSAINPDDFKTLEEKKMIDEKPVLGIPIDPGLPYTRAEIIWICRNEMPLTVEDVLARRTRALFLNARASSEIAAEVAGLMADESGYDINWQKKQIESYNQLVKNYI